MSFIKRLLKLKRDDKTSAQTAKERLQIIISHERSNNNELDYIPALRQDLIQVIRKYVHINEDQIKVELGQDEDCSILELNVALPHQQTTVTEQE